MEGCRHDSLGRMEFECSLRNENRSFFFVASVHKVLPFALSKSIASLVLRGMLIPKRSLTGVLIFFRRITLPLDLFGVMENFGWENPQYA